MWILIHPQKSEVLSPAKKQLVEIAKVISTKAKILIMDEPSAPLSASEVETMFRIVAKLKQDGITIIYISHRIEELFRISDRVTVMRDGHYRKNPGNGKNEPQRTDQPDGRAGIQRILSQSATTRQVKW